MAQPARPPLAVPPVRTMTLGGETFRRETLARDIQVQGLEDLHWMLRTIAENETIQQARLQNPANEIFVDKAPAKTFDNAQREVVVLFGSRLATVAMRLLENALRQNIMRAVVARTGKLQDIDGAWRWRMIIPGKGTRVVTSATALPPFVRGSVLVLEPYGVPYSTRVNSLIMGRGRTSRGTARRATGRAAFQEARMRAVAKSFVGPPKPKQPVGFLRATCEQMRSRPEFRQFSVTVAFSKQYAVPGEYSRLQGTGSIVVQLKRR